MIFINFLSIVLMQRFPRPRLCLSPRFIEELRENLVSSLCDVSWESVINVNRSSDFFSITHVYTCLLIILIGFLTVTQIWKIREMEPSPIALVFLSLRSKASFLLKFPPKFVDVLLTYLVKTLSSFSDNFLTRCYAICYVHRIVSSIAIFISY